MYVLIIYSFNFFHLKSFFFSFFCHLGFAVDTAIWIGGNDLANSGNWVWSSGKTIQDYFNFESENITDGGEGVGECLDIILDGNFQWRKSQCFSKNISHAFIAEAGRFSFSQARR